MPFLWPFILNCFVCFFPSSQNENHIKQGLQLWPKLECFTKKMIPNDSPVVASTVTKPDTSGKIQFLLLMAKSPEKLFVIFLTS